MNYRLVSRFHRFLPVCLTGFARATPRARLGKASYRAARTRQVAMLDDRRFARFLTSLAVASALAATVAVGPPGATPAAAQVPPPPPPVAGPTPAPSAALPVASSAPAPVASASAEPEGRGRRRGRRGAAPGSASPSPGPAASGAPEPTATPTSPAFATLDGTWEVQLQYIDHTDYSYVTLAQSTGGVLSGDWRINGKNFPLGGSYDGRLIRFTVKEPTVSVVFSGYVEGASDMVGQVDFGNGAPNQTPFTAEHRGAPSHNVLKKY